MLRRAVGNLLSNAIAHSFSDTVIEINIVESKGYSAISVINCGPTISAEHIDKIFDRFYRIDPARHGSSKNSGLGLPIVKSIMDIHHGEVVATSESNVTTLTLYFPTPAN
nr:ATP-binding protein [Burkholderia vietnamiensis]